MIQWKLTDLDEKVRLAVHDQKELCALFIFLNINPFDLLTRSDSLVKNIFVSSEKQLISFKIWKVTTTRGL